ncbi:MAG: methyltransferase domain-containing protein [Betaproteobacteria bacterium]|nr:methyltransferase domain-containing protein [Betaproteobacteria bacterium]
MSNANVGLWASGDAYEKYMGRWSRRIAPHFLDWLSLPPDRGWVDIGCGTGVLSSAILGDCTPSRVVGIDPSEAFVEVARSQLPDPRFHCRQGSAEAIPLEDDAFSAAVSGLVLNFVADKPKAVAEMRRVVATGGTVASYVWDYAGHMQIMRYFFDAASELDVKAREFDDGAKAPICGPGPLSALFKDAGLTEVEVRSIDIPAAFASFDDYWTPFLGGTGSAPKYCASLTPDARAELREALERRLPTSPDGEILLTVRAWAVKGTR